MELDLVLSQTIFYFFYEMNKTKGFFEEKNNVETKWKVHQKQKQKRIGIKGSFWNWELDNIALNNKSYMFNFWYFDCNFPRYS